MAINVLELHHHAVCMPNNLVEKMGEFYEGVMGLNKDKGRPDIPGIPGYWMDVPGDVQIHLMGKEGESIYARGPGKDPVNLHVALAVPDVVEAEEELKRLNIDYWSLENVAGAHLTQLFFRDPAGNQLELHEIGHCRCNKSTRDSAATARE